MERRPLVVDQVDRHLDHVRLIRPHPDRLDGRKAPVRRAYRPGDLSGDVEVVGLQIHVVGDQHASRADGRGPGRRMWTGRTEVGAPCLRSHLLPQSLEPAATDRFEPPPVRHPCGVLVEVDRDVESFSDRRAQLRGHRDADRHVRWVQRHQGHDVHRSDSGMFAGMKPEVDPLEGGRVERQQRRPQRRAFSNQREDGSVVRGVGGGIEQIDAGAVRQGGRQGLDDLGAPPLTDVGNRFYQAHTADIT